LAFSTQHGHDVRRPFAVDNVNQARRPCQGHRHLNGPPHRHRGRFHPSQRLPQTDHVPSDHRHAKHNLDLSVAKPFDPRQQRRSIRFEIQTGFTAPLTSAGTLLVNGVDASCFAVANSHRLANLGMMPVKVWYYVSKYIFGGPGQLETYVDIDFYSVGLFRVVSYLMPAIFS